MAPLTLCLIGAGRAGGSLARQWHAQRAGFEVAAIHTRRGRPELAAALSATEYKSLTDLPSTDAVLIATGDASIAHVAAALAGLAVDWRSRLIFHISGALASTVLDPLAALGAFTASAHPVRAFANDNTAFDGTQVGVEGCAEALVPLRGAFEAIGGVCFTVSRDAKTEYHAAAVIASNHIVALAHASYGLWQDAGLEKETATALFASLTRGVLDNLENAEPEKVLTGPIARADAGTIASHVRVIDERSARTANLYRELSRYLLSLDLGHAESKVSALCAALGGSENRK